MEKVKEFFNSPKKTAILGLVGSFMMLICALKLTSIRFMYIIYNLNVIGLVVYFIILSLRLYRQKGNIKVANYTLIVSYILNIILGGLLAVAEGETIITAIFSLIILLYFCNILLGKVKLINNKVFAIIVSVVSIYQVIRFGALIFLNNVIEIYVILYFIKYLGYMAIVPYFYNYYKLLREER